MSQVSVYSTTAPGRSSWRALRPLLLLGGFVAIWWALMTGVAQADSAPKHLLDDVRSQVGAHHEAQPSSVREAARRVHHDVKATAAKTTSHVRQQSTPVTKPVVGAVTKTVRSTVSDTVAKTRSLLAKTPADAVVDTVKNTVEDAESSILQGDSPSSQHSAGPTVASFVTPVSATVVEQAETSAAPSGKRASDDADAPVDGPRGTPPVHEPCASPSGSSTTSITPAGLTESSWLAMPRVAHDLHVGRLARLLDGPAYEPGSSPD